MRSLLLPTLPANVIPAELVTVKVPISVPIAPATLTVPKVLIVKLETAFPATPLTEERLILAAPPLPNVSV